MTNGSLISWFHPLQLFGTRGRVGSLHYFVVGVTLIVLKYLVELLVIGMTTGRFYSPLDFVNPLLSGRERYLNVGPGWLGFAWLIWTLPFLWICILMSVRRCFDAGVSGWISFIVLIPILNLVGMVFLAAMPSKDAMELPGNVYKFAGDTPPLTPETKPSPGWEATFIGLLVGAMYLVTTVAFCVYFVGSYGTALFFGAPIVTCAASAYWLNHRDETSLGRTIGHSILVLLLASSMFLLIGLEGGICIVMALPLFIPLAALGAVIGFAIAAAGRRDGDQMPGMMSCLALLPVMAAIENSIDQSPVLSVRSQMVIQAPIEEVWKVVIAFPEIQTPPEGLFRWGVAYPIRATITGEGVGSCRHCIFTTGTFVEPITHWEAPTRLSFDVTSQPDPMTELSPYKSIHPPHLESSFRSLKGEFRLRALGNDSTLLEGSTWYRLDIGPRSYWKIWTDEIVHRIHLRVLEHIRDVCKK